MYPNYFLHVLLGNEASLVDVVKFEGPAKSRFRLGAAAAVHADEELVEVHVTVAALVERSEDVMSEVVAVARVHGVVHLHELLLRQEATFARRAPGAAQELAPPVLDLLLREAHLPLQRAHLLLGQLAPWLTHAAA